MEDEITVIEARESVRKRPAMYIGSTRISGFVNLLKIIITETFTKSAADRVSIEIDGKTSGKISFYNLKNSIKDNINQDLPFPSYEFAVLNFLSERYEFKLFNKDGNELINQIYQKGVLESGNVEEKEFLADSLKIDFQLDESIWEIFSLNGYYISEVIRELAFLFKDKTFETKYLVNNEFLTSVYHFKNGMRDKFEIEILKGFGSSIFDIWFEKEFGSFFVEVALGFRESSVDESFLKSYVNEVYTHHNGTHVEGVLKGIGKAIEKYFQTYLPKVKYRITEKRILKTLVAAIHIKIERPYFEGAIRGKLITSEIIKPIGNHVYNLLFQQMENDKNSAEGLIRRFLVFED